jgi:hypothetical protein
MFTRHKCAFTGLAAILLAAGTGVGTAIAGEGDHPARQKDKLALGEDEVKQLVLLMDQDKNGKVSEQEFMNFMRAEFRRLDKDKSGELDAKELSDSQIRVSHFNTAGK